MPFTMLIENPILFLEFSNSKIYVRWFAKVSNAHIWHLLSTPLINLIRHELAATALCQRAYMKSHSIMLFDLSSTISGPDLKFEPQDGHPKPMFGDGIQANSSRVGESSYQLQSCVVKKYFTWAPHESLWVHKIPSTNEEARKGSFNPLLIYMILIAWTTLISY